MTDKEKKSKVSVTADINALPKNVQVLAEQIQAKHRNCWRPEMNPLFPGCVIESDPKSVEAMLCLRVLTLDRERYIGWSVWYASKLMSLQAANHLLSISEPKEKQP